jgi:hypothetical protein
MRLMMRKKRRNALVFRGDLVTIKGEHWVVTGYDEKNQTVYVARDRKLHTVLAEDIGLHWEDSDIAAL